MNYKAIRLAAVVAACLPIGSMLASTGAYWLAGASLLIALLWGAGRWKQSELASILSLVGLTALAASAVLISGQVFGALLGMVAAVIGWDLEQCARLAQQNMENGIPSGEELGDTRMQDDQSEWGALRQMLWRRFSSLLLANVLALILAALALNLEVRMPLLAALILGFLLISGIGQTVRQVQRNE